MRRASSAAASAFAFLALREYRALDETLRRSAERNDDTLLPEVA